MEAPDDDRWVHIWDAVNEVWALGWHDNKDGSKPPLWNIVEEVGIVDHESDPDEPRIWREQPPPPGASVVEVPKLELGRGPGAQLDVSDDALVLRTWGQTFKARIPTYAAANAHLQAEAPDFAWRRLGEKLVTFLRGGDSVAGSLATGASVQIVAKDGPPWLYPDSKPSDVGHTDVVWYWTFWEDDGLDGEWDECDSGDIATGELWVPIIGAPERPSDELLKESQRRTREAEGKDEERGEYGPEDED